MCRGGPSGGDNKNYENNLMFVMAHENYALDTSAWKQTASWADAIPDLEASYFSAASLFFNTQYVTDSTMAVLARCREQLT